MTGQNARPAPRAASGQAAAARRERTTSADQGLQLLPPTFQPWAGGQTDKQVVVLMSGGVDSSVTAMLLQRAGWEVLGLTMKIPVAEQCAHPRPCCGGDAALVCARLGLPHYFLDVEGAFDECVIAPFRRAYAEGRTPNPCVDCNSRLKFRVVWDYLERTFRVRHMATGHYARVAESTEGVRLQRAADADRDQSYFIYGVPSSRLSHLLLPLGDRPKPVVRQLAHEAGLPVSDKPDSMELCFAGEADYRNALADRGHAGPGPIRDVAGRVVGQHDGIPHYTLGQRRALRVPAGEPLYVTDILPESNTVVVGTRQEASARFVRAESVNVLMDDRLTPGARLWGKIRSYGEPSKCTVADAADSCMEVEFDVPQFAPCPGQHLVLYDDRGAIVAGGTIARPIRAGASTSSAAH